MSHNAKRPTPATSDDGPAPPKRRRVSRACDACRSAKDKCDGARPRCQRCISLRRQCTYLNPGKRRGIRTGYLRAIELALALLLESLPACEGVLLGALAKHGADLSGAVLDKDSPSPAAEALLSRWNQSEAFKAVGRLISRDEDALREDEADGESAPTPWSEDSGRRTEWNEQSASWRCHPPLHVPSPPLHESPVSPPLELPRNFRHYLSVYSTSTHSWFPIADEEALLQLAASYPLTGLRISLGDPTCALHSELWSAMALGAALDSRQKPAGDTGSGGTNGAMGHSGSHVSFYATARKLLPLEDGAPSSSHVRSLLLLSLVKLAQDEMNPAWLLIGQAVTSLLQLVKNHSGRGRTTHDRHQVLLMGCFVLDTLVSLVLGNPSHMRSLNLPNFLDALDPQLSNLLAPRGKPSRPETFSNPSVDPSPVAFLFQQYKFANVLSQHLTPSTTGPSPASRSGASDLIDSLDPPFHFCNSLVQESSTLKAPGAVLAQAGFLGGSILLSPTPAPRLIQSLVDVVGQYISSTKSNAPPPLLAVYVELAMQNGRVTCLGPDERARTSELLAALKGGMETRPTDLSPKPPETEVPIIAPQPMGGLTSENALPMPHPHGRAFNHAYSRDATSASTRYNTFGMPNTLQSMPNNNAGSIPSLNPVLNTGFESNNPAIVAPGMPEGYSTDYDAILDELSSMDYVDSNEPDPQFMANLGFAPGSELNDMFGGHFGLV